MDETSPNFSIGQLVQHKLFNYRGVIIDVDPTFQGSDSWYQEMAKIIPLIVHLPPPGNLVQVDFCRFSEYFIKAEEWGLSLTPDWRYRHICEIGTDLLPHRTPQRRCVQYRGCT